MATETSMHAIPNEGSIESCIDPPSKDRLNLASPKQTTSNATHEGEPSQNENLAEEREPSPARRRKRLLLKRVGIAVSVFVTLAVIGAVTAFAVFSAKEKYKGFVR